MSSSYDPTLKTLVEASPADWLPLLGLPLKRVTVEDTDLATVVSGAVDKVLRVHARPEYLLHLDFQRATTRQSFRADFGCIMECWIIATTGLS